MKIPLILWCSLGLSVQVHAQSFFYLDQPDFNNETSAVAVGPDGSVYMAGEQSNLGNGYATATVHKMDITGQKLWMQSISYLNLCWINKILPMSDGGAVVVGQTLFCDYGSWGIVGRLDTDGAWMWKHVYALSYSSGTQLEPFNDVQLTSDGRLQALGFSYVFGFNATTGFLMTIKPLPVPGFFAFRKFYVDETNERYFLNNTLGAYAWNPATDELTTIDTTLGNKDYKQWLVLDESRLLTYKPNGEVMIVDRQTLAPTFWTVPGGWLDAAWHPEQSLLAVLRSSGISWYDEGGQEVYPTLTPGWNGILAKAIAWQNDTLVVAGSEKHTLTWPQTNHSLWGRAYVPEGLVETNENDAMLVELVIDVAPTVIGYSWGIPTLSGGAFSVRVKNNGGTPLQSVILSSMYGYATHSPGECRVPSIKRLDLENIHLLPGQDTLVFFGSLDTTIIEEISGGQWQFCAWTSMPNNRVDADHANNQTCVWLPLTVAAEEPQSSAFSIFPNPATDDCTITWGENLRPETVRIFDLVGRLLRSEAVDPSAGQHALQLSGLVSGVYVVELGGVMVRVIRSSSSGQ